MNYSDQSELCIVPVMDIFHSVYYFCLFFCFVREKESVHSSISTLEHRISEMTTGYELGHYSNWQEILLDFVWNEKRENGETWNVGWMTKKEEKWIYLYWLSGRDFFLELEYNLKVTHYRMWKTCLKPHLQYWSLCSYQFMKFDYLTNGQKNYTVSSKWEKKIACIQGFSQTA